MRKETIIKYEKEFLAWCKGESVLLGAPASIQDRTLIWREVRDFNDWNYLDTVYVLNDSYSIYRKALAEGKTIEYLGQSSNLWQELEDANFNLHQTCYRIKPDEPKFKVGDFVRYIHHSPNTLALQINNINCGRYYFVNSSMSCVEHELEPWKPIKDEWCWFYDSKTNKHSHLSQFNSINNGYFKSMSINYYNFCEPFLNSKPSYLRDM